MGMRRDQKGLREGVQILFSATGKREVTLDFVCNSSLLTPGRMDGGGGGREKEEESVGEGSREPH